MKFKPQLLGVYWNAKWLTGFLFSGGLFLLTSLTHAEPVKQSDKDLSFEEYRYSRGVVLRVEHFDQAIKLFQWLDFIKLTEIGTQTLDAIDHSGHQLTIYHSEAALYSAGATGAPLSGNLINGIGEDVYIKFYLDMDQYGTNCVLGKSGHYIEYTAIQNLFHELSHARHKMTGTWLYFDSEGQAIREENIFRLDWAKYRFKAYAYRTEYIDDEDVVRRARSSCQEDKISLNLPVRIANLETQS